MNSQRKTGAVKGSYILLIELTEERTIPVGSLKTIHFYPGHYAYIGSALGGLKSRLSHHLRTDKKPHWHIDYLLQKATINDIIVCETSDRIECTIAQALSPQFDSVAGFGCSDCSCRSHLFFAAREIKLDVIAVLDSLGMESKTGKSAGG